MPWFWPQAVTETFTSFPYENKDKIEGFFESVWYDIDDDEYNIQVELRAYDKDSNGNQPIDLSDSPNNTQIIIYVRPAELERRNFYYYDGGLDSVDDEMDAKVEFEIRKIEID